MSTHCEIGCEDYGKDGNPVIHTAFCHFDGYPRFPGMGYTLLTYFNSKAEALKLTLSEHRINSIDYETGMIEMDEYPEDGGSITLPSRKYSDHIRHTAAEYVYLFRDNRWLYQRYNSTHWIPLTEKNTARKK